MHAPVAQQNFGLGTLIGSQGSVAPSQISIEAEGRGVFAKLAMHFEFAAASSDEERLFILEKPWDAVPSRFAVNGEALDAGVPEGDVIALPLAQFQAVDGALSASAGHLLTLHIPAGQVLSSIDLEFILAVDLQWHKGSFRFFTPAETRQVSFAGRWDFSGLPGAGIVFTGAAETCRLQTLEASRHRWSEPLTITPEQPAVMEFSLDEKRAASISVFSPCFENSEGPGCAAVAVVAPIRPQLVRDAVRLAIVIEIRNPQEGLVLRSMVERVASMLKSQDEFTLLLVGTDEPRALVPWSSSESFSDEMLAKFLDPTVIGRAADLWGNLHNLSAQLRTSTHLLLASPGATTFPNKGLLTNIPVFVFATGRRPFKSQLESLAQRSGGFLVDGNADSLDNLLERIRIRLSPPLLSDFKLEGWGLSQVRPAGATQVYTDQPTLVFGLYEGLLPKTVTLSGQSPARQKLAQRVKVEPLLEIDLMPLYRDRLCRWDGGADLLRAWKRAGITARCLAHPDEVSAHFSPPQAESTSLTNASAANTIGLEGFGPPTMLGAGSAVSFDAPLLGAQSNEVDDFFSGPGAEADDFFAASPSVEFFEGAAGPTFEEPELFQKPVSAEAVPFRAPHIRAQGVIGGDFDEDEIDLFEDPAELNRPLTTSSIERGGSVPSGPPAMGVNDSQEGVAEPGVSAGSAPSTEEPSLKKKLLSWRQRTDADGASSETGAGGEAVASHEHWNSEWLESFLALESEAAKAWLNNCSIDQLGLAVSLLESSVAEDLLARLDDEARRRAVRMQMELGRLLDGYEREQADRQLALALTSSGH